MRILLLNQTFHPDVVSTAQHASDLAQRLVQQGHEVTVVCSRRAYDNPARQFPKEESWRGVRIVRIWSSGFGKAAKLGRVADFGSFLASCLARLLLLGRHDLVIAMTSPPLISFLAALYARVRRSKLALWIMDLNPDEAIAAGWLSADSGLARALNSLLAFSLRAASRVIVLDRFMRERIVAKGVPPERIEVIPPWSHGDVIRFDEAGRNRFRAAHGLTDRFVVMYSGNHSPCHPLDTLLEAARRLSSHSNIAFCFIGGGSEFRKVKAFAACHGLRNILCLPYQPFDKLSESLSAADLHTVVMGDPFAGVIHPCKIYNILALGTPFLYIGPPESHVRDLIAEDGLEADSYCSPHGDVAAVVASISRATEAAARQIPALLESSKRFSVDLLAAQMVRALEDAADTDTGSRIPERIPKLHEVIQ